VKRKQPEATGAPVPTTAVEVRPDAEPERVDFHFPVEIHMEQKEQSVDLDAVAEHVFDRLARRLT
jgi:hypothetical protein